MKKRKYEENKGLTGMGIEYRVYRMNISQKLISFGAGAAAGVSAAWVFFGAGLHLPAACIAGGAAGVRFGGKYFKEKRIKDLTGQFRDFLESVSASLSAGQNVTGAIEAAYGDMKQLYGERGLITLETARINDGIRNNLSPEKMFTDFAERSGQKDIRTFAETFGVCNRSGGNMRDVIAATTRILSEKMQTEKETDVIASKGRNELAIMTAMPFIIIPMLKTLGDSSVSGTNIITVAVRAAGALLIGISVLIGRKITDIKM